LKEIFCKFSPEPSFITYINKQEYKSNAQDLSYAASLSNPFWFWFYRLTNPDQYDAFGIIVSYSVKVKLYLGALGGELTAELPLVLMHPKVHTLLGLQSHWPSQHLQINAVIVV
jgi:hypothetical protein